MTPAEAVCAMSWLSAQDSSEFVRLERTVRWVRMAGQSQGRDIPLEDVESQAVGKPARHSLIDLSVNPEPGPTCGAGEQEFGRDVAPPCETVIHHSEQSSAGPKHH